MLKFLQNVSFLKNYLKLLAVVEFSILRNAVSWQNFVADVYVGFFRNFPFSHFSGNI